MYQFNFKNYNAIIVLIFLQAPHLKAVMAALLDFFLLFGLFLLTFHSAFVYMCSCNVTWKRPDLKVLRRKSVQMSDFIRVDTKLFSHKLQSIVRCYFREWDMTNLHKIWIKALYFIHRIWLLSTFSAIFKLIKKDFFIVWQVLHNGASMNRDFDWQI